LRFTSAYRRSAACSASRCSCMRSASRPSSSCALRRLEVASSSGAKPGCRRGAVERREQEAVSEHWHGEESEAIEWVGRAASQPASRLSKQP